MLYSVQLKNMYSHLNSSLKLSDIVRGLSCQQSYCNLLSLYKLIIIIPFILFYLTNFTLFIHIMQVRVGSTLSDLYDQEQGVPQGGVLSTTLFNIKINDIVKCLDNLTDCSLYVDYFCICFRSKSMRTIERHLQQNLNKREHWATNNGFKFSK